ncbi:MULTISPECIES: S8 family serine peptidase [unclassified Kitasatospora]|uniref:S8 family serine peptidase n=1 Tax=unclassified Kitasatospora TaxID=2633591 RepID=UPI002473A6DE|nr:S8 family serine peptidase [Kitasatospora sp. GAS204B]
MPEVWQTSTGAGVTVAVIDSGFKSDLPDLTGQLLPGKDFSGLPGGVNVDPEGHGTGMASDIAGSGKNFNGKGASGLAPGARILPIKINTNSSPSTAIGSSASLKQIDQGITYAVDQGAKVISISQGIEKGALSASDISALQDAVNYAVSKGRLIVASAGNSGQQGDPVMYPSAASGVAAIAAFDHNGTNTPESEYGPQIALAAPGIDIISACTDPTGYCKTSGTSDATALTAAAAAILWQVHPSWTGNQILRVMINTANKPTDGSNHSPYIGFGNISPRNSIRYTGDPGPADVNPLIAAGIDVKPSAPASAPGVTPSGAAANPSAPAAGSKSAPASTTTAVAKSSSSSLPLIIGGVVVVLVVAGVVVFLVRRKRSTPPPPPAAPDGYPTYQQPPGYGTPQPPAFGPGQPVYPPQPAPGNPYQQAPPSGPSNPPQG